MASSPADRSATPADAAMPSATAFALQELIACWDQGYEALADGLQPIVCVDSDLLTRQAAAFAREELEQLLWAWTPDTPVSLEMARTLDDIAAQVAQVARKTEGKGVLYGGGVTPDNGGAIWTLKGVSGILLGQGSLDAEKFAALVNRLPV